MQSSTPAGLQVVRGCGRRAAADVQLIPQGCQRQDLLQAVVLRPLQVPCAQRLGPDNANISQGSKFPLVQWSMITTKKTARPAEFSFPLVHQNYLFPWSTRPTEPSFPLVQQTSRILFFPGPPDQQNSFPWSTRPVELSFPHVHQNSFPWSTRPAELFSSGPAELSQWVLSGPPEHFPSEVIFCFPVLL